ncbi:MAG: EAL domain-containing protein, partial [Bulleidia sp.]
MKAEIRKAADQVRSYFASEDLDVSKWDQEMLRDFYSYNISLCITASAMVCIISFIGLIGTYSPYMTGFIIPGLSAQTVYLIIFAANAISLAALNHASHHMEEMSGKQLRGLFVWVTGINMILASATFFTTQENSSFFFEYILITIIVYLLPNSGMFSFFRNMVINIVSIAGVLSVAHHPIAWQDIVDIVLLQVVCAFVNQSRLQSFVRREKEKISMEKQKEQFYHDSRTDELTHISNRTALRIDFPHFLNHPLCAALADLDFFKKYNDTYGHEYGDGILEMAGSYLTRVFHDVSDHCYRYGGDEFLIISEEEEPESFRTRLQDFQKLCDSDQDEIDVTFSIGYYSDIPHNRNDLRSMIRTADAYLYQAKRSGTGRIDGGISEAVSAKSEPDSGSSAAEEPVKAGHDPLTGLPDMRSFLDTMRQYRQKKRDADSEGELAALYFDLINFRMINLLYGMSYGDETLKKMGKSLQDSFPHSIVSHWDVDHFAVLTDTRNLEKRAEDALNRLGAILPFNTECSVGACVWDDYSLDAETICSRARAASDENRKEVGIHFSYYTEDIGRKLNMDTYVVSHIDEAIEQGWITVYYQPIVRALSNQICGMEALARWKDPEKGLLPPAAFVGPLEDAKQIYKLDLCVIRQTVKLISDRYRDKLPEIPISINLSRLDFLCCDIYQEIEKLVMDYDIPRRMLHIEVTESIMRSEEGEILRALQSFRNAGYELWMDDFGSGYSTLNLLKDYSFDLLKLDMGFLRSDSSRSRDIIISVIEMDKRLGIRTLAEGVETEEQAEFLKKSGCEKLQGYYFSKPLPFEESLQNCLEKGIGVESAQQKICYDALGHVNFMTDIPLLISEVRDDRTHLLFANDHGLAQFRRDGFSDLKALEDSLNDTHSVASREMLKAVNHSVNANDSGEIAAYFNGKKRLVQFQLLGSYGDTRLFVTHIYGKSREEDPAAVQNQMLVNLTYFYRYLFTINTDDMTIQNMRFVNLTEGESKPVPLKTEDGRNTSLL